MDRKVLTAVFIIVIVFALLLMILLGCSQDPEVEEVFNVLGSKDSSSPVLVAVTSVSSSVIRLEFNEPVRVYGRSFEPLSARADGKFIFVSLDRSLLPGMRSDVKGRVKDYSGNTSGFTIQVWGFNPQIPEVLINEFTTKGTAKSPDRTELRIITSGNINGMTLYCGVPNDFDVSVVFDDIDVRSGDMIVVWWTKELPEHVTPETTVSEGSRVFNICAGSEDNLPSNNGVIVLCDSPALGASVMDAVIYSNFSQSHEGFGTKAALERAHWVMDSGAWDGEALDSTSSTATRSMSRLTDGRDSDSSKDWIITVTGGATFGNANTSEAY